MAAICTIKQSGECMITLLHNNQVPYIHITRLKQYQNFEFIHFSKIHLINMHRELGPVKIATWCNLVMPLTIIYFSTLN